MSVCARTCFLLGCTYCGCIHLGGTQQRMWECVLHFLPRLSGGCLMTRCMVWIAVRRVSLSGDAGNICSEHFSWAGVSVLKRIYFWSHVHHLDFFLWYSHRKKTENRLPSCFFVFSFVACAGGGGKQLDVSVSKSNPRSMRARPLLNKFAPVKPAVEDINDLDPLGSGAQRPQATRSIPNQ